MKVMPLKDSKAAQYRFLFLFLVLLGNLLLYPYAGDGGLRYQWFRALGFGLTALSVYVLWNISTIVGALAGNALGSPAASGLDVAGPAAFTALLAPRLRTYLKSPRPAWSEIVDAAD